MARIGPDTVPGQLKEGGERGGPGRVDGHLRLLLDRLPAGAPVTDPTPADETPEGPPAIEPPAVTVDPLAPDHVRRAVRATRDAGIGYGIAWSRAGLRAAIGLGKAGPDVALKVLDQSAVGGAAGSLADRLEPAAESGRRQREATAEQVEAVLGQVVGRSRPSRVAGEPYRGSQGIFGCLGQHGPRLPNKLYTLTY